MALNYQAAVNISAQFVGAQEVEKAKRKFAELNGSIKGAVSASGGLEKAMAGLVGVLAVREVLAFGHGLINLGDRLNDLRQKTGVGVQALSDFKAAAEDGGVGFEQFETAIKKFTLTLGKAQTGQSEALSGFNALGLSLRDSNGRFLTADELLFRVSDRFSRVKDGADKTAVAVALFGKAGADMIPTLNQGSAALKGLGIQMSDKFVKESDQFNDALNQAIRGSKQFGVDLLEVVLPALNGILGGVNSVSAGLRGAFSGKELGELDKRLANSGGIIDRLANNKLDILKRSIADVGAAFAFLFNPRGLFNKKEAQGFGDSVKERSGSTAPKATQDSLDASKLNPGYQATLERIAKIKAEVSELDRANTSRQVSIELAELENRGIKKGTAAYAELSGKLKDSIEYRNKIAVLRQAQDYSAKQAEENSLRETEILQVNFSTGEYKKLVLEKQREAEIREKTKDLTRDEALVMIEAVSATYKQKEALIELEEAQRNSFGEGAKQALRDYAEAASDSASLMKNVMSKTFQGIEDGMVDFITTGKASFADLARTIERELVRIVVKQAVLKPLLGGIGSLFGFGFADGGVMTGRGPVSLQKYASGGIANSPQLAMFGEGSRPEAYVPLPDGRSIPVTMDGGTGSTSVVVNVAVSSGGADSKVEKSDSDRGKQMGQLISAAVTAEIIKQKRPGGLLA